MTLAASAVAGAGAVAAGELYRRSLQWGVQERKGCCMTVRDSCVHFEDELGGDARGISEGRIIMGRLAVRHAEAADEKVIRRLLETGRTSSRKPWPDSPSERSLCSLVAEERGGVLAVACYRTSFGRLVLGPLAVHALVVEYRFALALYSGAALLAQSTGKKEVWVESDEHREYLLETGYHRRIGGWRLDVSPLESDKDDRGTHDVSRNLFTGDQAFFRPFWGF